MFHVVRWTNTQKEKFRKKVLNGLENISSKENKEISWSIWKIICIWIEDFFCLQFGIDKNIKKESAVPSEIETKRKKRSNFLDNLMNDFWCSGRYISIKLNWNKKIDPLQSEHK